VEGQPRGPGEDPGTGRQGRARLQSWFIQRVEKHINKRGRRMIGWDEILEGGLAPNATVMSWRGIDGAVAAAKQGHDAVLAPDSTVLYMDRRQSASADEPPGRIKIVSLKDVYEFDAAPSQLTEAERAHILGLQANVFTEHMRTDERLEQMTFPRACRRGRERLDAGSRTRTGTSFARRLPAEMARLEVLGVSPTTPCPSNRRPPCGRPRAARSRSPSPRPGRRRDPLHHRRQGPDQGVEGLREPWKWRRARPSGPDLRRRRRPGPGRDYPRQPTGCPDPQQPPAGALRRRHAAVADRRRAGGARQAADVRVDLESVLDLEGRRPVDKGCTDPPASARSRSTSRSARTATKIPLRAPATPGGELEVRRRLHRRAHRRHPAGRRRRGPGLGDGHRRLPAAKASTISA
jgi:hexosaminidase